MSTITAGIQMVSTMVLATIMLACLVIMRRWNDARLLLIPPFLWSVYGVFFYLLLLGGYLSPEAVLLFGAIHRLLAGLMVLGGVITLWAVLSDEPPDQNYDEYPDDGY